MRIGPALNVSTKTAPSNTKQQTKHKTRLALNHVACFIARYQKQIEFKVQYMRKDRHVLTALQARI